MRLKKPCKSRYNEIKRIYSGDIQKSFIHQQQPSCDYVMILIWQSDFHYHINEWKIPSSYLQHYIDAFAFRHIWWPATIGMGVVKVENNGGNNGIYLTFVACHHFVLSCKLLAAHACKERVRASHNMLFGVVRNQCPNSQNIKHILLWHNDTLP